MPALLFQVSNLFARDEIDEITSDLISVMKKEHPRRPPTNENLYDYFMSRVRQKRRVCLSRGAGDSRLGPGLGKAGQPRAEPQN